MRIAQQTPSFGRAVKKMKAKQKEALWEAVKSIQDDPFVGEEKRGDLKGVWVHKFKIKTQLFLVAYVFDDSHLTFIYFGTHENFYRDLKRIH